MTRTRTRNNRSRTRGGNLGKFGANQRDSQNMFRSGYAPYGNGNFTPRPTNDAGVHQPYNSNKYTDYANSKSWANSSTKKENLLAGGRKRKGLSRKSAKKVKRCVKKASGKKSAKARRSATRKCMRLKKRLGKK